MYQRGIRGAITVDANTVEAMKEATIELLTEMKSRNNYDERYISNVVFTLTDDLDCVYPAKIAREEFQEWKYVPMVCFNELKIQNSLRMCLRVLITLNTDKEQEEMKHVYLKGAEKLRQDLK